MAASPKSSPIDRDKLISKDKCSHPKTEKKDFGWGSFCGKCGLKL